MRDMQDMIRLQIEQLLKTLKPEIKERAVFMFGSSKNEGDGTMALADTAFMSEPPVITFYLETIERINPSEEALKQIISHELIHTFSKSELDAYSKQGSMDFFNSNQ